MAKKPTVFRPIDPTAARKRRDATHYQVEQDPDEFSPLMDSYRDSWMGAIERKVEILGSTNSRQDGFVGLDHVPQGYDQYADAFASARNPDEVEAIRQSIDARLQNRSSRVARGSWETFKADLLAGIFDPSNLIGGPALKGTGLLAGTVKGAIGLGSVGLGTELLNWKLDPTMTGEEAALRAGSAVAFGGVLGGTIGGVTKRGAAGAAASVLNQPARDQTIRFVINELEGGARIVDWGEAGGLTKYGIAAEHNPGVNTAGLTESQAMGIARQKYWLPELDKAPPDLAAVGFDAYFITGSKQLVGRILRTRDARAGLQIYRDHLAHLAATNPKKARFAKGWNNRVDRLASFLGAPKRSRYDVAASASPSRVDFRERGYIDVREGPTGLRDAEGRYIPAAFVRGRAAPKDEFTLVAVDEQPARFETVEETRPVEVKVPAGPEPGEAIRPTVNRRFEIEDPSVPRKVETELDAAIELDRLERGDHQAIALTTDEEKFEDWLRAMGKRDELPFGLKDAARGKGLEVEDMLFMRGPVTEKGLAGLNQPELNRLRDIIHQLSLRDPRAAKIWMGNDWNPGDKLTKGQVKKRLDTLVARRAGLREQAGARYERDVSAYEPDEVRHSIEDARVQVGERIDTVHLEIARTKTERDQTIGELHLNDPGRKALKAEYEAKISLQYERLAYLLERRANIEAEAKKAGRAVELDTMDQVVHGGEDPLPSIASRETPDDLVELNRLEAAKKRLQQTDVGELRQRMAEKQDMIVQMHAVARDRALGARSDEPYIFSKKEQALLDRLYREVGELLGRVSEVEALQAVDRDLDALPFGIKGDAGDGARVEGDADHIVIDVEALLASFEQRPWVQSVHGAPGLPEETFKTPEEWVNFVYFHEREHVQNPRQEGENLADYESRINDRALEALRGESAPWKPVDGWKEELVLRPTPIGQFMRLVKNPVSYAYESLAKLASDYDLRLQRNLVPGGASPAGGSVYTRSLRWQAMGADYYNSVSDLFLRYVRGRGSDGDVARQFAVWRNRKGGAGKMSFDEFDKAIGRVQATGEKSGIKEVDEAAGLLNQLFERIRREEENLGLLPGKATVERELKAVQGLVESIEAHPRTAKLDQILGRWKERAAQLEQQLIENPELPGKKGLPYFERLWNVSEMMKRPDEVKRIFAEGYQREGQSPQSAWASATALYDDLVEDPALTAIEVAARPGSLRGRNVPVENDEVVDFIHQNSTIILARHMRRNGAAVEMTRAFGDPVGEIEADRVLAALEADGLGEGEIEAAMQIWFDMRDRIVGGFHGGNPLSTTNRIVRSVKHFTRTAVMGLSGISQFTDFVRSAWVLGPKSLAKSAIGYRFFQEAAGYDPGQYARAAGEALDVELGILSRRMIEDDDWALLGSETAAEKWLADVQVPFFIMNGVTPFTVLMKRWVARTVPTLVLDRADRVAAAVRSGRALPEEDAIWLRELGIDEHDAQLLADLPRETTPGGLHLVDMEKWAETAEGTRGKNLMIAAISGTTRRSVATPGPLNRPAIFDGVVISKKKRKQAWQDRWIAEQAHDDARLEVQRLRKSGMGPGDEIFDTAVENLKMAAGDARRARNNIGVKARVEAPLLSLPLQLQSFSMSQASKLAHAVLSDRDKHKLAGLLSLWAGGMVSAWVKGEFTGSNENASIDEFLMRGFQNSGIMTWFSIPLEGAKGLLKVAAEEGGLMEGVLGEDRPGLTDNAGALGPGIGLGIGGLEGLFGKGFDGADLPASQRSYQIRRLLPFGNMIYFNWLTRTLFDAVTPESELPVEAAEPAIADPYGKTIEQLQGFTVGDDDPAVRSRKIEGKAEAVEIEGIDSDAVVEKYAKKIRLKRRSKKPHRLPVGLLFDS